MNTAFIKERLQQYYRLTRLDKPIGTLLLLWPTLWGLWVAAKGLPDLLVLVVFVVGVVLMRSAGCVINDFADRKIDLHVERTQHRPITSGKVSPREALALFAVLCLIAFLLVLLMNRLTIMLSFVAVALAAIYPFTQRIRICRRWCWVQRSVSLFRWPLLRKPVKCPGWRGCCLW
jgi:4-hydroxybenzoate polyprenyltransferase